MGGARQPRPKLRVDARKFAAQQSGTNTCQLQVAALLACLQQKGFDDQPGDCAAQYAALQECTQQARIAAAARKGHVPSINFHLARMAKLMKR
jgi:hypothetical protein